MHNNCFIMAEIAMADAIERGRIPDPPPRWYPLGSIVSSSSEGITSARRRGPTLMHASWNKDKEKIKILLNGNGQPIMSETGPVATQMGVMARDGSLLPLHYNDWRYVPPHYKRRVWEEIKAHTTADDSMERWYMQSLGKKWQGWKSEAKKQGYKPYDNDADRLAHRPNRVTEEQWRCLVYYWSHDKKIQAKSATNQSIRNSQTLISTSGRTSHARVVQQKDSGKNPTRLDTFGKTHTRKDGTNLNEETSAILDKLKELQQPSQDGSNTTPISEDEIFIQAIGPERPGRKRGCGLGVTSTQQLAAKKQHQEYSEPPVDLREFNKMKSKLGKMEKAFETMGYIFEDSDDDLDESFPKEKAPDASSVDRQMTTDSLGDNSQERHPESREAGLLSQLNARPNSQGECCISQQINRSISGQYCRCCPGIYLLGIVAAIFGRSVDEYFTAAIYRCTLFCRCYTSVTELLRHYYTFEYLKYVLLMFLMGSATNPNSQAKSGPSESEKNQQTTKEADVQALAELTCALNKKGSPTNPNSQGKSGPSETGNRQQTTKEARVQALAELTRAFNQKKIERETREKLLSKV
ncbi:hypothetical protein Vadar_017051 [Vaccinium darrowii]|uniref:Uncharacterized protein n=1 Tax=Vaccinium darrowii TaxID=229202 RepID=A0ACB7X1I6_9ERIC|nr:hypothetical protein Vadar_017051 [Vaccinium darrowii]